MNDKRSQFIIVNDIMNDIVNNINDKRPFLLHEQCWYRTALLKMERDGPLGIPGSNSWQVFL